MRTVTPWYPGTVKPVRPGVYEREFPHRPMFSEWTGLQWLMSSTSVGAARRRKDASGQQELRWRGLVERA